MFLGIIVNIFLPFDVKKLFQEMKLELQDKNQITTFSQLALTCLKLSIETLEQSMKYVQN